MDSPNVKNFCCFHRSQYIRDSMVKQLDIHIDTSLSLIHI